MIANRENLGIAAALNQAAAAARACGCDWLLTLDQDSEFEPEILVAYLSCFAGLKAKEMIAVVSPTQRNEDEPRGDGAVSCRFENRYIVMTSGNLLNLALHKRIGGFDEKLFIDEVDHDYCLRAHRLGCKVLQFTDILLEHRLGRRMQVRKRGVIKHVSVHVPSRLYYMTRNTLYMWKTYRHDFPSVATYGLRRLRKRIRNVVLYEKHKAAKLWNVAKGFAHFSIGRYGK